MRQVKVTNADAMFEEDKSRGDRCSTTAKEKMFGEDLIFKMNGAKAGERTK